MKALLYVVFTSFLLGLGWYQVTAQGDATALYKEAEVLRNNGDYGIAIQRYDEAIAADGDNYRFHAQKARCQYALKDLGGAKRSLLRALDIGGDYIPANIVYLLGKIYREDGNEEEAIRYYEMAANRETNPKRKIQYQMLLVQPSIKAKEYNKAERYLQEAEEVAPDNVVVMYYHGELASAKEDYATAQQYYEQALRTTELRSATPVERARYYLGLGLALRNQDKQGEANKAFRAAAYGPYEPIARKLLIEGDPSYYYQIAVSYFVNEEYSISEEYIQDILRIDASYVDAYALRARIAQRTQSCSVEEAATHYREGIKVESDNTGRAKLYMQLANLYLSANQPDAALTAVESALSADSRSARSSKLTYVQARASYLVGRYADAETAFARLLQTKLDPRSIARYNFMRGMTASQEGNFELAKASFTKALYGPFKPAAQTELDKLKDR